MVNYNNKSTNPPSGGYGKGRQDDTIKNYNRQNNNQGNNNSNKQNNELNFTKEDALKILNPEDKEGKALFEYAEKIGESLGSKKEVSVSQLRKIYSEIKKLEYDEKGDYKFKLRLIKAQIGYTAGRFTKLKDLKEYLYLLIDEVLKGNKDHLIRFKNFFEAVIAYHRAYGGK